ncbi:MAG: alpha-amylase, partial [Armatimonadetes bacterium]|nr:alpha-amylase [Anaerolineae bacterium]
MRTKFLLLLTLLLCSALMTVTSAQPPAEAQWWNDRAFYQLFVRSFYDSDGDGIGDFQGVIQQLDYLNDGDPATDTDLGVTGLWLMPIHPSPSYHGYDVTDYYGVNAEYGTLDDFKELVAAAQARGMVVMIDWVLNHTSSQHPWFIDSQQAGSEYDDWYVWRAENPGYQGPENQTVWYKRGDRYYYGIFWSEMPDLNYRNPDVTAEMYAVTRFWLDEVGID